MSKLLEFREVTLSLPGSPGEEKGCDDTSFRLLKGERLALVGDHPQRLSLIRDLLLGKLPAGALVKGGELCYRGEDLFQVSNEEGEELRAEMAQISGNPASSFEEKLPVGLVLSEAIGRWQQRRFSHAQDRFEMVMRVLEEEMLSFARAQQREDSLKVPERISLLRRVCQEGARLDAEFSLARDRLTMLVNWSQELLEELSKGNVQKGKELLRQICSLEEIKNPWLFPQKEEACFLDQLEKVRSLGGSLQKGKGEELTRALKELLQICRLAFDGRGADFYGIAWLKEQGEEVTPWLEPLEDLFDSASRHFGDAFLNDFCIDLAGVSEAIQERCALERGKAAQVLEDCLPLFEGDFEKDASPREEWSQALERARGALKGCTDPLEMGRETREKTFGAYLERLMEEYLAGEKENEEIRRDFESRSALYQRWPLLRLFRKPPRMGEQKDTLSLRKRMAALIRGLARDCRSGDLGSQQWDIERAQEIINDLLESSREAAQRPSFVSGHCRAMELLQEVGIEEPFRVCERYPWQLSSQELSRAQLSLALVQNPRILIWCPDGAEGEGLDDQKELLKRLLRIKKARRLTLLILTQSRETALTLAERIVEL